MRVFVDTNVFVYLFDRREPAKQALAATLLASLLVRASGVISTQVISELSSVLLGRRADLIRRDRVRIVICELMRDWQLIVVRPRTIETAFEGVERFGFSWFDAQIWAAAKGADASYLLTEDFADGLDADGVRVVNPFNADFDAESFIAEITGT